MDETPGRDDRSAEGSGGEPLEASDPPETRDEGSEPAWYTGWRGPLIVWGYLLLTLLAVAVTAREIAFAEWLLAVFGFVGVDAPAWLTDPAKRPSLATTVPFDVYLFGLAGALTRFLLSFVTDIGALTRPGSTRRERDGETDDPEGPNALRADVDADDDGDAPADDPDDSELELLQLVLGLPAAVYLAAGVFLAGSQLGGVIGRFDPGVLVVILAYLAGFYVRRTYELLGDVADRLLEPVDAGDEDEERGSIFARTFRLSPPGAASETDADADRESGERPATSGGGGEFGENSDTDEMVLPTPTARPRYSGWRGVILFGAVILVALGVLAATLERGPLSGFCDAAYCPQLPLDVSLYALMGGVGYVFTKLFVDVERTRRSVVESSARIFAGVFLAVGIYLVFAPVEAAVPAVSFLVGLYLNVAVVRFDALAEQLFDRLSRAVSPTDDENEDEDEDAGENDVESQGGGGDAGATGRGTRDREQ